MIPSKRELESEIKRCGFKMEDMPEYIESLLEEHLEDHGDDQFRQGLEEGRAACIEELKDSHNGFEIMTSHVEFAISALRDVLNGQEINQKLTELEFERCRLMPVTP